MQNVEQRAVSYAASIIPRFSDWQEVANELVNHDEFGPWLEEKWGDDLETGATNIVRKAERRLGSRLPSGYSD